MTYDPGAQYPPQQGPVPAQFTQQQTGPAAYQPPPGYPPQQAGPPPGYPPQPSQWGTPPPPAQARRKRRVFLWVFLAIQALFVIWIISALAAKGPSIPVQVAQACNGQNWSPLFKSHQDCVTHFGGAMNDATNIGKGLGVALIVLIWVVLDFFLGLGYGIYKLATR